jgi:RNA polymerase sigma-70 factor (ECF subfamily)
VGEKVIGLAEVGLTWMGADLGVTGQAAWDGDEALLTRMAAGDGAALTALYERHGSALFGYLLRLADDYGLAEEILQDTLWAAWQSAGRFEGRSSVRTWLFGIGRRQAHNRFRGRKIEWADLGEAAAVAAVEPGPEETVLARSQQAEMAAAMEQLGSLHTEVLGLAFIDDLSYAEIARVLGVPVGTVKSRLFNAKRALAAVLDEAREDRR